MKTMFEREFDKLERHYIRTGETGDWYRTMKRQFADWKYKGKRFSFSLELELATNMYFNTVQPNKIKLAEKGYTINGRRINLTDGYDDFLKAYFKAWRPVKKRFSWWRLFSDKIMTDYHWLASKFW